MAPAIIPLAKFAHPQRLRPHTPSSLWYIMRTVCMLLCLTSSVVECHHVCRHSCTRLLLAAATWKGGDKGCDLTGRCTRLLTHCNSTVCGILCVAYCVWHDGNLHKSWQQFFRASPPPTNGMCDGCCRRCRLWWTTHGGWGTLLKETSSSCWKGETGQVKQRLPLVWLPLYCCHKLLCCAATCLEQHPAQRCPVQ